MARRSAVRKADASDIDAEQLTDQKIEDLQDSSVEDGGDPDKKSEDDDEDEDEVSKADDDQDDDGDDDEDDEDETDKSRSSRVSTQLKRAITRVQTLAKSLDPSARKEALFAKSMAGGKLTEAEADELDALVRGRSASSPLRERAAPQLSKSLRKAVSDNAALTDLVKGLAGSHSALCDEIDHMRSSMDEVHCLLAKCLGAMGEGVSSIHQSQGAMAEALDKALGQPAYEPRSVGLGAGYAERPLHGQRSSMNVAKAERLLGEMQKSAANAATRDQIAKALFHLQTTKTVSAPVQQMIQSHLADA